MPRLTLRRLMAAVAVAAVLASIVKPGYFAAQGCRTRYYHIYIPCFPCMVYDQRGGYPTDDSREIAAVGPKGYGLHWVSRPQGTVIFYGFGPEPFYLVYGIWLRKDF